MEWSWLKDWWRLKSLRRRHRLFPIDATHCTVDGVTNTHDTWADNGNSNGYNNDEDDDASVCFCDDCMSVIFNAVYVEVAGSPRITVIV